MLCCHGTSADHLDSILKEGLKCNTSKIWHCSDDAIYCWSKNLLESEGIEEEEAEYTLFRYAYEAATCGLAKAKDCRAVVVFFDVPEEELEDDDSCENMESANCIYRDIKPEEITEIRISNDLSLLRGYFIMLMLDHNLSGLDFNKLEERIGSLFKNADIYPEDIDDILEWNTVYRKVLTPAAV